MNYQIGIYIFRIFAILLAISIHEFGHGAAAYKLGDSSQKYRGRLTLNPLAHLDPIGAILLLTVGFGWAKPVEVNPYSFKNPRKGLVLVSLAGPITNLTLAFFLALPWRFGLEYFMSDILRQFLQVNIALNIGLAAFNLIPIPPLDGSKVLMGLLPGKQAYQYAKLETFGPILLILLVMTGMTRIFFTPIMAVLQFIVFGR